jgi:hypothetical protein
MIKTIRVDIFSASARISKGEGYQCFFRKRAGSSFGQKRAICVVQGKTLKMRKTDIISLLLETIKCLQKHYNYS